MPSNKAVSVIIGRGRDLLSQVSVSATSQNRVTTWSRGYGARLYLRHSPAPVASNEVTGCVCTRDYAGRGEWSHRCKASQNLSRSHDRIFTWVLDMRLEGSQRSAVCETRWGRWGFDGEGSREINARKYVKYHQSVYVLSP